MNTLGVAQYRAGDYKAARETLTQSIAKRGRPDASDEFFLAMTFWKLGDREQARRFLQEGVKLMKATQPPDRLLPRFQAEAEALFREPGLH